jgi:hypothetical protein
VAIKDICIISIRIFFRLMDSLIGALLLKLPPFLGFVSSDISLCSIHNG